MKKIIYLPLLLALVAMFSCTKSEKLTVAFYNVENLFDTIDTPNKIDEEYLPTADKNWNTEKYLKKCDDLGRVIWSIDSVNYPALVGLAEVENDIALSGLINSKYLKDANYSFVWNDGPDRRGIDNVLLYKPEKFSVIETASIPVINTEDTSFITRDILYVKGYLQGDLMHVFVNHWPSRWGGEEVSASKRNLAASILKKAVDEIMRTDVAAKVIIMGDMNDEPMNASLKDYLQAQDNDLNPTTGLVNLMYDEDNRNEGSYNYRGDWNMIDNIVVSTSLIDAVAGFKTTMDNGYVFNMPFMEFVNKNGEMSPNRTYGRSYYGGISDHFPVYFTLTN